MLKRKFTWVLLLFAISMFYQCRQPDPQLQEGDIVFQSYPGAQGKAIELATHSQFSHTGIVLKRDGKLMVFEAVQPVRFSTLSSWINQGKKTKYVAMRLKSRPPQAVLSQMEAAAANYTGKDYDSYFNWDDEQIYCSELVWKLYKGAGIELCKLKKFKDYDFSNPLVQQKCQERYGDSIPMNESIVAPEDIYQSSLLQKVAGN